MPEIVRAPGGDLPLCDNTDELTGAKGRAYASWPTCGSADSRRGSGGREIRSDAGAHVKLERAVVVQRGEVSDTELDRARGAGLTDSEVVETVANVALNIFTIYVAHVARPALDFHASRVARPPNGVEVRRG